jgi:hypothetical protein
MLPWSEVPAAASFHSAISLSSVIHLRLSRPRGYGSRQGVAEAALRIRCAMKLALLLPASFVLSSCSTAIYKTGWEPKEGTLRTEILAKLGPPLTTVKEKNMSSQGVWPTGLDLKDRQGRKDHYVTRRMIADPQASRGAQFFNIKTYGALELIATPYAAVDHWFPKRRSLTIYYDRHDRVQGIYIESVKRTKQ